MYEAKVSKAKLDKVDELARLISSSPLVGIVNMESIPAPQLQRMRAQLKDKLLIRMSKKSIINRAIDASESARNGVSGLHEYVVGMPALVFTKENPFRLSSILRKSKTSAPAKPGQSAPRDIIIQAGPTQFAPGPIISELSSVGLKTGVEGGKVSIRQDHVLVCEGDRISQKVADVMAKLGIQPMEIGLDLVAIYEDGVIYAKDVLAVDEQQYVANVINASFEARSLALFIAYPAMDVVKALLQKAFNDAKAIALSRNIVSDVVVEKMVVDAERQAKSVSSKVPESVLKNDSGVVVEKPSAPSAAKSASDDVEKEIDREIEEIKHEKEMEKIREIESVAHQVLTKGKADKHKE